MENIDTTIVEQKNYISKFEAKCNQIETDLKTNNQQFTAYATNLANINQFKQNLNTNSGSLNYIAGIESILEEDNEIKEDYIEIKMSDNINPDQLLDYKIINNINLNVDKLELPFTCNN